MRLERPQHYAEDAGFTLVELLVAMTLTALLSVGLYSGLRLGIKAWERNLAHSTGTNQIGRVQDLLREAIGNAYPSFLAHEHEPHVDFQGRSDGLTLRAPAKMVFGRHGYSRITFDTERADRRIELQISAQEELSSNETPILDDKLLDGLQSLSFAYFGQRTGDDAPSWHEDWSGETKLPLLVRVSAAFPEGDARRWPELVIAPAVTADAGCIYDPLTHYCRGR